MKSNPTIFNTEFQNYINWIIKKVYKTQLKNFTRLGSDLSTTPTTNGATKIEDGWSDSYLSNRSIVQGYLVQHIKQCIAYLKNSKQTTFIKTVEIPLKAKKVTSFKYDGSKFIPVAIDGEGVTVIDVPEGFDGNESFVEIGISRNSWIMLEDAAAPSKRDKFVVIANTALGTSQTVNNALLILGGKVNKGNLSFKVAKTLKSVIITICSTGLSDEDQIFPEDLALEVKVTFFKRGIK